MENPSQETQAPHPRFDVEQKQPSFFEIVGAGLVLAPFVLLVSSFGSGPLDPSKMVLGALSVILGGVLLYHSRKK